jgi:hypothetical protein
MTEEIQILTKEFAVDLDSCFALGKAEPPLFVTSNTCIPFKHTLSCFVRVR